MKIEHVAVWTANLEAMREFYARWFEGRTNEKYANPNTGYESYFVWFESGARLELMTRGGLGERAEQPAQGYVHMAFSVGSRERVDDLTAQLRAAGVALLDGPRQTGDGYYESTILDPDGNLVEITV